MDAGDYQNPWRNLLNPRQILLLVRFEIPKCLEKQMGFMVLAFFDYVAFYWEKIMVEDTLILDWKFWLAGAVFVYFFSVSGAMFNIIRKMPMVIPDGSDPNKLVYFYQGWGMQLGVEGFTIGFLYTIVVLLLVLMTHLLVRVRNVNAQRLVMIVALLLSCLAVKKVVFLDNWKTGYGIHLIGPLAGINLENVTGFWYRYEANSVLV